jgi:hypothetical protein
MIVKYFNILIPIGSLLWILGFSLAAATVYPFALIGIYFGPPILILGIIGWIINYKRSKDQNPNPIRSFKRVLGKHKGLFRYHSAMFEFMFSHLFHFWTFCIIFWIGLTFLATTVFKNSNAFTATKQYVENDTELINRIGQIEYFGFLVGGSVSSSGEADISFSIIGEKETVNAKAKLESGKVIETEYN